LLALPGNVGKLMHKTRTLPIPTHSLTYSQGKIKDLVEFVERSGVDNLSDKTYRELLDLIELSQQHNRGIGPKLARVSKEVTDELYQATLSKGKPLNR
jgi:hypothetical protein